MAKEGHPAAQSADWREPEETCRDDAPYEPHEEARPEPEGGRDQATGDRPRQLDEPRRDVDGRGDAAHEPVVDDALPERHLGDVEDRVAAIGHELLEDEAGGSDEQRA